MHFKSLISVGLKQKCFKMSCKHFSVTEIVLVKLCLAFCTCSERCTYLMLQILDFALCHLYLSKQTKTVARSLILNQRRNTNTRLN